MITFSIRRTRQPFVALATTITSLVIVAGCSRSAPPAQSTPHSPSPAPSAREAASPFQGPFATFVDRTEHSGVTFVHTDGSAGQYHIVETISGGLAILDYDGDGWNDLFFCNGGLLSNSSPGSVPTHRLYRNLGDFRFRDVTVEAGLASPGFGLGVTAGDFDNDGYMDLYVSHYGPNVLYHNNGDGSFSDVTSDTPLGRGARVGAGVCFLDIDGDGDLDLFAAQYVKYSPQASSNTRHASRGRYPGPLDFPPETNSLFRNEGDGRWTDVSETSGIAAKAGTGMGAVCGDFDADGDVDICVANDEMANFLYRNDGQGRFDEVGIHSGVAFDALGAAQGSMGIVSDDFDHDGRPDFYITSYQNERATLYRNAGNLFFQDVTPLTGAGEGTVPNVTWGCCLADLDNDGDRDLYVVTGHLDEGMDAKHYRAPDIVLRNLLMESGEARFVDVSRHCGDGPQQHRSGRGLAVDDLDHDGDLDVVVLNSRDRPNLLVNRPPDDSRAGHWLQLNLCGVQSPRDGTGTSVRVKAGNLRLVKQVQSGCGYQSHWGTRVHVGLGSHAIVERLEVEWSGGGLQVFENIRANQFMTIVEGRQVVTTSFNGKP